MKNKISALARCGLRYIPILLFGPGSISAQNLPVSPYGLPYIHSIDQYQMRLAGHPERKMLALSEIPTIRLNLKYAGDDNFMHKKLYPEGTRNSFLREPVFRALKSASGEFSRMGLSLVVFDAYRPYRVTIEMWNRVLDERYAASPAKGSGHNRGLAVDVSLADSKTGRMLSMPTDFDNFSDTAQSDFAGLDPVKKANRELLKGIMVKNGFISLSTEWWHFSWPDPSGSFDVLDLSFAELQIVTDREAQH